MGTELDLLNPRFVTMKEWPSGTAILFENCGDEDDEARCGKTGNAGGGPSSCSMHFTRWNRCCVGPACSANISRSFLSSLKIFRFSFKSSGCCLLASLVIASTLLHVSCAKIPINAGLQKRNSKGKDFNWSPFSKAWTTSFTFGSGRARAMLRLPGSISGSLVQTASKPSPNLIPARPCFLSEKRDTTKAAAARGPPSENNKPSTSSCLLNSTLKWRKVRESR